MTGKPEIGWIKERAADDLLMILRPRMTHDSMIPPLNE